MCVHTSHRAYGYPLLTLCSWQWMHWNPWCNSQHLCCHYMICWLSLVTRTITCASFNHIQLLLSMNWHYVYQRWHSHSSQHCHCRPNTSEFILHNSKNYHLQCNRAKKRSYCNQHPINQFLPLIIEVFGCLHKHADMFLHNCVNTIWSLKGPKGLHLYTLVTFFHQKISITLQRMQASSILNQAITISLTASWHPPLQNTPPITITIYCKSSIFDI